MSMRTQTLSGPRSSDDISFDAVQPPSIRAVQAFVAVAELSSYRAAADRLFIDSSTVSRLVSRLERSLGIDLFDRNTRQVELTTAGVAALKPARRALRAMQDLVDEVDAVRPY
jgi:DNA-binding transcriptional LysR family regulator